MLPTRNSIIANFLQSVECAEHSGGSACLLSGSSGIGKTETISQFLSLIPPTVPQLTARALPTGSPSLFPIYKAIANARLQSVVQPAFDQYIRTVPIIRDMLDPIGDRTDATYPSALAASELHTFCALGGLLRVIAAQGAAVMFIDDAQWLDMTTIKFLGYLTEYLDQLPLFIFIAAKTNGIEAEGVRLLRETLLRLPSQKGRLVSLPPLNTKETKAAVERILEAQANLSQRDLEWLVQSSNGNPKYLAEIIALLRDKQQLVLQQGAFVLLSCPSQIIVPPSLAEIIRARFREAIGDNVLAGSAINVAAVIGRRFNIRLIAKAINEDPQRILAALECLGSRTQYLHRLGGSTEMEFDHDLTREALLGGLGDLAADLHAQLAQILSSNGSPKEIAHHFQAAGNFSEAAIYLRKAAKDAFLAGAYSDAADLFREQDTLLASLGLALRDSERAVSIIRRGRSLLLAEDYKIAAELLRPACQELEGTQYHAQCLHILGKATARLPSVLAHEESVTALQAALAAASQKGSESFVARVWADLISTFDSIGEYQRSEKAFRAAMQAAHLSRDPSLTVRILRLTCIFWQPEKVVAAIKRALTIATSYRLGYEYALCMNNLGTALYHLGQSDQAKACLTRSSDELARLGGHRRDVPLNNLGLTALSEGKLSDAQSCLSGAASISRDPQNLLFIRSNLAVLKAMDNDYAGAFDDLKAMVAIADESGDLYYRDCLRHNLAQVLLHLELPDEAVRIIEECPPHHDASDHQLVAAKRAALLVKAYRRIGTPVPGTLLKVASQLEVSTKPQAWLFRLPWYLCDIEFWED